MRCAAPRGVARRRARRRCGCGCRRTRVEAEQAVLGGLLLDNATWDTVADRLRAEDFYRRDHQLIFGAIAELSARSEPSDAVTLAEYLAAKGLAEEIGRARLSRRARARHADRGQHPRLRRHRPRALAAAPADPRERRDRRRALTRTRAAPASGAGRRRRATRVRDRRAGPPHGIGLRAAARRAGRHHRPAGPAAPDAGPADRRQHRLHTTSTA